MLSPGSVPLCARPFDTRENESQSSTVRPQPALTPASEAPEVPLHGRGTGRVGTEAHDRTAPMLPPGPAGTERLPEDPRLGKEAGSLLQDFALQLIHLAEWENEPQGTNKH